MLITNRKTKFFCFFICFFLSYEYTRNCFNLYYIKIMHSNNIVGTIDFVYKKTSPSVSDLKYAKPGDACMDLTAQWIEDDGNQLKIGTGICLGLEPGMVGLIYPRSSISKTEYSLANSVGVIDSGYRGELIVVLNKNGSRKEQYMTGDRVAQLMVISIPTMNPKAVEELDETERGTGGFGSTGK